jgi:hypothetical protein
MSMMPSEGSNNSQKMDPWIASVQAIVVTEEVRCPKVKAGLPSPREYQMSAFSSSLVQAM